MRQDHVNNFHNSFCATRSVGTAAVFVACCAIMAFAGWRGASGKPHPPDSGAFFLSYQAITLLVAGLLFTAFKCTRERVVIALSLFTQLSALLFAARPNLASFRPILEWIDFAVWTTALVISLTMLASALRSRNRPSPCESS